MSTLHPNLESVTTINADGSRHYLHPADTRGFWTQMRRAVAVGLGAMYVLLPWIPINGSPAVLLDVVGRRFHLFGTTLAAQDTWLLFFLITGFGFTLIVVTALFGRVWCGWACPQTVFLEHLVRRLERWIDGDAVARRRLDDAPWTAGKVVRRIVKHALFVLGAGVIVHVFLSYFVSLPQVYFLVTHAPAKHWGAFAFVAAATGGLYFDFAWFREQFCIVLCPYGRLQSALIDEHSLVIGYDRRRGEPRKGRGMPRFLGDCVDCLRCVHVCPTGIDIRQGLQMECIGCTACIDACDEIMVRVQRPPGLIRYDSLAGFAGASTRWLRPRTVIYSALLLVGAGAAALAFSAVKPAVFTPLRMPGGAYYLDAGAIRNQFLVRFINKTTNPQRFAVALTGAPAAAQTVGLESPIAVAPMQEEIRTVIVRLPRSAYTGSFRFALAATEVSGRFTLVRDLEFLGPDPQLLDENYGRENSAGH